MSVAQRGEPAEEQAQHLQTQEHLTLPRKMGTVKLFGGINPSQSWALKKFSVLW